MGPFDSAGVESCAPSRNHLSPRTLGTLLARCPLIFGLPSQAVRLPEFQTRVSRPARLGIFPLPQGMTTPRVFPLPPTLASPPFIFRKATYRVNVYSPAQWCGFIFPFGPHTEGSGSDLYVESGPSPRSGFIIPGISCPSERRCAFRLSPSAA